MEEKKNQVMELTTEVGAESTEGVSVETGIEIIPESNRPSGKLVAIVVAGIASLTAGAAFMYKRHKKKKINKKNGNCEDFDDNKKVFEDDIVDVEEDNDQENGNNPKESKKDKNLSIKK